MIHEKVETVLLDIDDTLWENNVFFLQSLDWVCKHGALHGHTRRATTALLNHREHFNISFKGYGYGSYEHSLLGTIRILAARSGRKELVSRGRHEALRWTKFLRTHPIVWLDTVEETLPVLTERFRTIIVTKGHFGDQMGKVNRCGKKHLFAGAEVVPHKYPDDYHRVMEKYDLRPETTIMVGNSPRSDINMAKRAGLRTVYIPHAKTWFREMEPIRADGPKTIEIRRFQQLLDVIKG